MSNRLEGRAREILEGPNCVTVSVARPDGSIQSVVACVGVEGENVTLNSDERRIWAKNLSRARRATVLANANGNPLEWVSVEGEVVEATTEGAAEHMDALASKYGMEQRPYRPDERRIRFMLRPTRVVHLVQESSGKQQVTAWAASADE